MSYRYRHGLAFSTTLMRQTVGPTYRQEAKDVLMETLVATAALTEPGESRLQGNSSSELQTWPLRIGLQPSKMYLVRHTYTHMLSTWPTKDTWVTSAQPRNHMS